MIFAVIDTNVLVSGLMTKRGHTWDIIAAVFSGDIGLCYDSRILEEYSGVLRRAKFAITKNDYDALINYIKSDCYETDAPPVSVPFADKSDKKFYEVAKAFNCKIITGNLKHFPADGTAVSPADFCKNFLY